MKILIHLKLSLDFGLRKEQSFHMLITQYYSFETTQSHVNFGQTVYTVWTWPCPCSYVLFFFKFIFDHLDVLTMSTKRKNELQK